MKMETLCLCLASIICATQHGASAEFLALARKLTTAKIRRPLKACAETTETEQWMVGFVGLVYQARVILHERAFLLCEHELLEIIDRVDHILWEAEPALEHMHPQVLEAFDPQWIRGFPRHWPQGPRELTEALRSV